MDGTWPIPKKEIIYVVCSSCKRLVKKEEIIRNGYGSCWRCVEI